MKFILVPLFILGILVSFAAVLIAMLFITGTVKTVDELVGLMGSAPDSTGTPGQLQRQEDRLEEAFKLSEEYRARYQEQARLAEATLDSLTAERARLKVLEDSLVAERRRLGLQADSSSQRRQAEKMKILAKFYTRIKPQFAAEILQQKRELSDTTVAQLMKSLPPTQMAKIMGNMSPDFAARITKLMQEMAP